MHEKLIENYKKQNWKFCNDAIQELKGSFKGEMDSFYNALSERILKYMNTTLPEDWSPIISKKNN